MSTLILNGQEIGGEAEANMSLLLAILAIVEAGETHMLSFSGPHGRSYLMVNPATQAQLVMDPSEAARFPDMVSDLATIIRSYDTSSESADSPQKV